MTPRCPRDIAVPGHQFAVQPGSSPNLSCHALRYTSASCTVAPQVDDACNSALILQLCLDMAVSSYSASVSVLSVFAGRACITVTVSLDEFAVLRTVAHWSGILVTCCHLHPAAAVQVATARRAAWWCHRAAAWCHLRRADQRSLKASWAGVRSPAAQSAARRLSRAVSAADSLISPSRRGRGWPGYAGTGASPRGMRRSASSTSASAWLVPVSAAAVTGGRSMRPHRALRMAAWRSWASAASAVCRQIPSQDLTWD